MELTRFLELWDCEIILEVFSKGGNMERYQSIVKFIKVAGARHAFLLSDGQTWVSVFLRKEQRPEFQQAVRGITSGQEYIFDCERNERGFLNIFAVQHVSWPTPIYAKDMTAAPPLQPSGFMPPPVPQPFPQAQAPALALQPTPISAPGQAVQPPPVPPPQVVVVSPAAPPPAPTVVAEPALPPITNIPEPAESGELPLKERLILRENAANNATNLLCAIITKGDLPENIEEFIKWVEQKFIQLQDLISDNTAKPDDIPF
jgi:hypothetical protein